MNTNPKTPEMDPEKTAEFITKMILSGKDLYEARGLEQKHMDALYTVGHNLYSGGDYESAEKVFQALCLYNHKTLKNWMALGASSQMQKKYEAALVSYSYAQFLDLENPMPAMHAFECHLALKNYPEALNALDTVIAFSGEQKKFAELKSKAEVLKGELAKAIQQSSAA